MTKDFTPTQAARWVAQELAKATTPAKVASRIASEIQMIHMLVSMSDIDMPNSEWAHNELLRRLRLNVEA